MEVGDEGSVSSLLLGVPLTVSSVSGVLLVVGSTFLFNAREMRTPAELRNGEMAGEVRNLEEVEPLNSPLAEESPGGGGAAGALRVSAHDGGGGGGNGASGEGGTRRNNSPRGLVPPAKLRESC